MARVGVERDGQRLITSEHACGRVAPVNDAGLHTLIRDLRRAHDAQHATTALEVLTRR